MHPPIHKHTHRKCNACWASAAVFVRQIAISLSMRRTALWQCPSHKEPRSHGQLQCLISQCERTVEGLLSGGEPSSLSLVFNRPSMTKGCRLWDCVPFGIQCVNYGPRFHCCPDARLITPVANCTDILFGPFSKDGSSPVHSNIMITLGVGMIKMVSKERNQHGNLSHYCGGKKALLSWQRNFTPVIRWETTCLSQPRSGKKNWWIFFKMKVWQKLTCY